GQRPERRQVRKRQWRLWIRSAATHIDCRHTGNENDEGRQRAAGEGPGGSGVRTHFTQNVTATTACGNSGLTYPQLVPPVDPQGFGRTVDPWRTAWSSRSCWPTVRPSWY